MQYRVSACNAAGCGTVRLSRNITPLVPPSPPANLAAALNPAGPGIHVSWTDQSTNESGFILERRTRNVDLSYGPYSNLAPAPAANATAFNDPAGPGTYQYRIRACNAAGCSMRVGPVEVTKP
jgi:hypothetical protein